MRRRHSAWKAPGGNVERAERLIDRLAVAQHLEEHPEVRAEALDEDLGPSALSA
jgi:hypothetical protein